MTKNVGTIDRAVRFILGIALLLITPQIGGAVGLPFGIASNWGWIGLIPLGTALIGWCPPYAMLGISTCSTRKA